ncbi:hypothetical protein GOX2671 (plasmid) [Gluconobacter oxydans 621H]|uniref:Uncharacterized protein n=1 Tax=Gluconobacter oxydans (strain 621H) TaxID=290633 RepID=Q5HXL8_GLUOX|nr:hypothetical protein GOX2671 [Gluconobacter oxydans 621H]
MRQKRSSGTGDTTVIKSGSLSQNGRSPLVFRRRITGNQSHFTTGIYIKSATSSKTCSQSSKTGGGWQHDMTAAHTLSCPLSTSQQASSSTSKNES